MLRKRQSVSIPTYTEQKPLLTSGQKKGLAIGGTAVGIPGYLYQRGLRRMGVPTWRVPQVLKRDIQGGYAGSITGTMRHGAEGLWTGAKETGKGLWREAKAAGGGIAKGLSSDERLIQLNAKLDQIIRLETTL